MLVQLQVWQKERICKPVAGALEMVLEVGFFCVCFPVASFFWCVSDLNAEKHDFNSASDIFSSVNPEDTLDTTEPWLCLLFTEIFAVPCFSSAILDFCNIFSQSLFFILSALLWNLTAEPVFARALNLLWIDFFVGDSCFWYFCLIFCTFLTSSEEISYFLAS